MGSGWQLLEYDSKETLRKSIEERERRVLFYPAIGQMQVGHLVDLEIFVVDMNVLFPMKAMVVARRTKPRGTISPRGVYLEIISEDAERFNRLCEYADGIWKPGTRRSVPRLRVEIAASYRVANRSYPGIILDISRKGVFLRTDGPLVDVGQSFSLRIRPSRLRFSIGLSAKVCWIDSVDSRRGMGLYCLGPKRGLKRLASLKERLRYKMTV